MKLTTSLYGLGLAAAMAIMGGCASQPKMTQDQIMSEYPQLSRLDAELSQARGKNAELLAPETYARANDALVSAIDAAESGEGADANAAANQGLRVVNKLNRDADRSRRILSEVLHSRDRAYTAGADTMQKEKILSLDNDLKKTASLISKGQVEQAKQRRPELIAAYAKLELSALKQGTAEMAKQAIANAKQQGAGKRAPKTLSRAEEEMKLAVAVLDADRTQTEKADKHAKRAKWIAEQSASISETVKDFDRRDYTMEDVVLWHQQQLSIVNQPIGGRVPFNLSSDKATQSVRDAVSSVVTEGAQHKVTGEKYSQKLATTEKERQALVEKNREDRQRFEKVQGMFSSNEANVYRQRQNVLIAAHGFQFLPGRSEIQAGNFPLMNKITRAIKTFPNARIEINGHTDSTGGATANQTLSKMRADKVRKFLIEVGGISSSKIQSRGFGESRPVATNKTKVGRAENRRVEIKIVNE